MEWCLSSFSSSDMIYFARKYLTSSATDKDIIYGRLYWKFQVLPSLSEFLNQIPAKNQISSTSLLDQNKFYGK